MYLIIIRTVAFSFSAFYLYNCHGLHLNGSAEKMRTSVYAFCAIKPIFILNVQLNTVVLLNSFSVRFSTDSCSHQP